MPRSVPPTAHFFPTRDGSRACSHDTKNASASRCTMVESRGMGLVRGSEPAGLGKLGQGFRGAADRAQHERKLEMHFSVVGV